jgi:hypothetical protein
MSGTQVRLGESRPAYKILLTDPQEKGSYGRLRCRWDRDEIECEVVDWIQLVQGRIPRYGFRENRDKLSGYMQAADKLLGSTKTENFLTS